MNNLEIKGRNTIIPKTEEILSEWDEIVANLSVKLAEIAKKI